jgi:imidazolonepropionase-like amidohydrolase
MSTILLKNCTVWDATRDEPEEGCDVVVEGDRIKEISSSPVQLADAREIDLGGRTLMPGLIDCHAHVNLFEVNVGLLAEAPLTLMTAHAANLMRRMIDRGFTTVRDTGGADWGIKEAVDKGLLPGPKLYISGAPLSQTGGHGDFRSRTASSVEPCACSSARNFNAVVADGITEVRRAARDQLRKGADQIKVMVSGGVASQNDPIDNKQYSEEELRAIVEEAEAWNTYVAAHAYTARSIHHAISCGVRTIEHGNLIDLDAAKLVAAHDAFVVPTLVTYRAMDKHGKELGLPEVSLQKLQKVLVAGLQSVEICLEAGVKLGFGTDLLGELQAHQSLEFSIRAEIQPAHDVLASATLVNAEILGQTGELGVVAPGARADLLAVDGNPLDNLELLQEQGRHMPLIIKSGEVYKNEIA